MIEEERPKLDQEKPHEEESSDEEKIEEPNTNSLDNGDSQYNEASEENLTSNEIEDDAMIEEIPNVDTSEELGELSDDDIENIDALLEDDNEVEESLSNEEYDDDVKVVSVKELTERTVKRNTIEAALLAAQRPIGIEEISIKLEISKTEILSLIQELAEDYMDRTTAIEIVQIGEGYSMQIKPEYTEKIVKFASGGLIPKAVMRTLTIIAVKQPLLKSLLVKMRGSTAYEHCKFLIDRGYVTDYRKGRSSILETTDQFADTFGLSRDKNTLKKQLIEQLDIQTIEESGGSDDDENESSISPNPTDSEE